jgi:hypothetical protein
MHTLAEGLQETVRLIADTFRLWWRNLVPLLTWYLAGYVGLAVAMAFGSWLGEHQHRTLAVGVFSAGVLVHLVSIVGMIRTCAGSLYRWREAAAGPDETIDPTEKRLLDLLSLTLLPLVAVFSAWGFLDELLADFAIAYVAKNGIGGDYIFQVNEGNWKNYLPAIVVLLVLRRVLEAVDDRWPNRPTKFAQVWSEAFFLLLVVVIIGPLMDVFKNWFKTRKVWFLTLDRWDGLKEWFAGINVPLPDGMEFLWGAFWETIWPLFTAGVGEPLTWLAITAVVFGHRALSGVGVFRGTRLEARLGSHTAQISQRRIVQLTNQAPNLVLGGLREKFYPTLNAFRLLVQVGPVFLGVVCLVYTLHYVAQEWAYYGLVRLFDQREVPWNLMTSEYSTMIQEMVFDTLRIALLAAAFDQCVSVAAEKRAEAKASEEPAEAVTA